MKSCKSCGKWSFVLNKDGLCKNCSAKIEKQKTDIKNLEEVHSELLKKNTEYANMSKSIQYQDKLLSDVNIAKEKFKTDNDVQAAIAVYEKALIYSNPPLKSNAHTMFLENLYIQAGEYDKAWAYLNGLITTNMGLIDKIRKEQCRILKKEKKYEYAMQMLVLAYLANSKWKNMFRAEAFIKEAMPIANKLEWQQEVVDSIAECIQKHVDKRTYDEARMIADYESLIDVLTQK